PCRPPHRASTAFAAVSALLPRHPLPTTSASSSLSPSARCPCRSSFSRGRSSGDRSFIVLHSTFVPRHRRTSRYTRRMRRRLFAIVLACCGAILAGACAEPPDKEMQQAQGAIEAARAAGADRYAHDEFVAAQEALKKSE